jgi:MFS family permease
MAGEAQVHSSRKGRTSRDGPSGRSRGFPLRDPQHERAKRRALKFVLLIGVLSFFADFVYEGSRSILGPYLGSLGATAAVIAFVSGFGELAGYALRLFSGRLADATRQFWPIMIFGYVVQMSAVPALALTHNWSSAAALIILERIGKAIRNPSRDVMLSHAGKHIGYGWVFGLHEGLDQTGALVGPLLVAAVLAHQGDYHRAFAALVIPAGCNLVFLSLARWIYPRPEDLETASREISGSGFPKLYWVYLGGAALVAAGFADYPLIAYHLSRSGVVSGPWVAIFYSVAMAMSGSGSLLFGRLFDRFGFGVLIALTLLSATFAPLVFLGRFWVALLGAAVWGLSIGVQESLIPAALTPLVSSRRRASAFGLFTAGYGVSWFLGSVVMGLLYEYSLSAMIAFCIILESAAIPVFAWVGRHYHVASDAS